MKPGTISAILAAMAALPVMASTVIAIDQIPERKLVSKGGILYPQVGDAMQERFQTPPNVKDLLRPGMLIGVLPDDCVSVSSGALGDYYRCDHGLLLRPEPYAGKTVYRVIEAP